MNPHWYSIADDGVPELYLDHTLLSSARMCEARFELDHIQNYRPKTIPWALDFGTLFHTCIEEYYKAKVAGTYNDGDWLHYSMEQWDKGGFSDRKELPQYKALGGRNGFAALIVQYATYYAKSDNLKPLALEVSFGRNKEVPLLLDHTAYPWAPFRLYLSGRLDYLFDDGRRIGPLDHKTFSMSGKNPMTTYEVQEGMTGYIYAMDFIYRELKAKHRLDIERDTNVLWLNFVLTKAEPDLNKRFQRVPLYKTKEQLEEYRLRQISTAAKIYQIIQGRTPDWNASVCTNYWHSVCSYQPVHRLASKQDQLFILGQHFKKEIWNPEEHG